MKDELFSPLREFIDKEHMTRADEVNRGNLRIVMFAAEAAPYAKVGGLADVVGALPKELAQLGAGLSVVIPAYRSVDFKKHRIGPCGAVSRFDISMGHSVEHAEVFQTQMGNSGVDVYLIGSRKYFDRDGVYDDPSTKEGFPDNTERFIFFMKAGIELLARLKTPVDIIHCHDSHTAMIPGMIEMNHRRNPFFASVGTLFTIHNLSYQGLCPKESLEFAGIGPEYFFPMSPFEYWNQVNMMKVGIQLADRVNTVSRRYAIEIRTDPEYGMGLEGVLNSRKEHLSGIVNGIDYDEWNPEMDPLIPAHFSSRDLAGKKKCKEFLLKEFGLPRSAGRVPLVGIVSRLADQKGFDLIEDAVEQLMALDLQMVVLGTGQKKYHEMFEKIAAGYPDKIGVRLSFDNALAHRIEAGCDLFLMPSKFEPCGLNQLYSLRYGTIPIVRTTGGLADTVIPYENGKGTGFTFSGYASGEMLNALRKALSVYADPVRWQDLCIQAMSQDWSWSRSASEYLQLYQAIVRQREKQSIQHQS